MRSLNGLDGVGNSGAAPAHLRARAAAEPISFANTVGQYQEAQGLACATGVVFASPWGLEELCTTHKFWRVLAEKLSDQAIPSLRFDWPGTGDSLDNVDFSGGLSVWSDALVAACDQLKARSGCSRIIILSQSLGSVVAADAAARIDGLEAIVFGAPVISGRFYTRELSVWARMVDADLGLGETPRDKNSVAIASLTMPAEIAADLRKIDLMALVEKPAARCLVLSRIERPSDAQFADHLRTLGADVDLEPYKDFDKLISNPAITRLPQDMPDRIVEWIANQAGVNKVLPATQPIAETLPLMGDGFQELPVRFGEGNRLSGVVCEPTGLRQGATVVFLSSSYDRHVGWGRKHLTMARRLAQRGIASLRFDAANVGDSPPLPDAPEQMLYHDSQQRDVSEAVDFLKSRGVEKIIVVGRCSGAYLGFHSVVADPRISAAVLANPVTFYWAPGRSVDEAVREGNRTLEDYGGRMLQASTFKRLFHGELDLVAILRNLLRGVGRRILGLSRRLLRGRTVEGSAIYAGFNQLQVRNVPVALIYSERDPGLEHFAFYFDQQGSDVAGFANMTVTVIPAADHNLTPDHARQTYYEVIEQMALRFS